MWYTKREALNREKGNFGNELTKILGNGRDEILQKKKKVKSLNRGLDPLGVLVVKPV